MTSQLLLTNLGLGLLMGAAGQVIRAVAGLRKHAGGTSSSTMTGSGADQTVFSWTQFGMSLILGSVAGMISVMVLWEKMEPISKEMVLGLLAAGYSGSDFLEGVIRWLPKPPGTT